MPGVSEVDRLPVIKVWDQVLVPLQGEISDAVAERLFDQVLETIKESGAEGLIIDLTGIWMIDSHLCAVLSRLAAAARLMGAESIMCGMNAQIAITLQSMGIDMGNVRTALTLEEAFRSLGIGRVGLMGAGDGTDGDLRGTTKDEALDRKLRNKLFPRS